MASSSVWVITSVLAKIGFAATVAKILIMDYIYYHNLMSWKLVDQMGVFHGLFGLAFADLS